jgi:hypothetical protein
MNIPAYPGSVPPPNPPASRPPAPPAQRTAARRRKLVWVGGGALIFAALLFVRYATAPADDAAGDQPDRLEQSAAIAPDPQPVVPEPPSPETVPVESAGFAPSVDVERPTAPVVKPRPKKTAPVGHAKTQVAASAKSTAVTTAPIASTGIAKEPGKANAAATVGRTAIVPTETLGPAPVTLTGCLETSVNRDEFRLSDTEGANAPRSRSWRTGFLTKRSAPVALIESSDPQGMLGQVGKRVAATGQLVDREMKVSSVRVVSNSCE